MMRLILIPVGKTITHTGVYSKIYDDLKKRSIQDIKDLNKETFVVLSQIRGKIVSTSLILVF